MTSEELKKGILEKTAEYYRLVHQKKQKEPFVPGKSRVNYAGRVFDEKEMLRLIGKPARLHDADLAASRREAGEAR